MKKTGLLLIMALFSLIPVLAQKEQKVIYDDNVQKRPVSAFKAIETSSGIEVIISKGDKEELAVSSNKPEYLSEVSTVVQNGVLRIYRNTAWSPWREWKNFRIKVYVSYTQLEELKATSGASINCSDLVADKLSAKLNSGASINLSGTVSSLSVDGSSGAQFHSYGLTTTMCNAEVSSGAGIQVTVTKEISARASSGGFIRYKGEGLIRDVNVSSGGSVKRS